MNGIVSRIKHLLHFVFRFLRRMFRMLRRGLIHHWKLWILIITVIFLSVLFFAGWTYVTFTKDLAKPERLMNSNNTGLVITDRNGETIYRSEGVKDIQPIPFSDIAPSVQHATVAIEDKDFYKHTGLSLAGIARSVYLNFLVSDSARFGGSTITQQLVKNALLSAEKSYRRKFQEAVLAIEIERRYTKDEILGMYLNSIYYGAGSYGIKSASETYFDKEPSELNLAESAILAALPQAPSALSPFGGDKEQLENRKTLVLTKMEEQGYVTAAEKETALSEKPKFAQSPVDEQASLQESGAVGIHFALWVREYLYQKYGEDTVNRFSFRVQTTLDTKLQEKTEEVLKSQIERLKNQQVSNGAVIVLVPKTGEVLAMAGSRDWRDEESGKFNAVFALRQPGSSFKPIVYTRAFMDGTSPGDILHDKATDFSGYKPKNYDGKFRGDVTIRRSLANSLNVPAVELLQNVGVQNVIRLAQDMGITSLTDPSRYGLSLVLGGGEVQLFEIARAYGVLANAGTFVPTHPILSIHNKFDTPIYTYHPETQTEESQQEQEGLFEQLTDSFDFAQDEPYAQKYIGVGSPRQVIPPSAAYMTTHILADNTARAEVFGTGSALLLSRQAAAKTGTTDSYRDSWTIGYTPDIVTGVWIGNNDNTPMAKVAGSIGAAPIWRDIMEEAHRGKPKHEFERPGDIVAIEICAGTGRRACTETCERKYTELFLAGKAPPTCDNPSTPTPGEIPTDTPAPDETTDKPSDGGKNEEPTEPPQPTQIPSPTVAPPTEPPPTPTPTLQILPTVPIPTL